MTLHQTSKVIFPNKQRITEILNDCMHMEIATWQVWSHSVEYSLLRRITARIFGRKLPDKIPISRSMDSDRRKVEVYRDSDEAFIYFCDVVGSPLLWVKINNFVSIGDVIEFSNLPEIEAYDEYPHDDDVLNARKTAFDTNRIIYG